MVANHAGVLARVAGVFSRRGFNIDSLAVGPTQDPAMSRMTIVVEGDERIVEQVSKQLNKLVDVIKVSYLTPESSVGRELALIKVQAEGARQRELVQIAEIFRAKVVDVSSRSLVIEVTGDEGKLDALLELLRPFGILELARTGKIAMQRGLRGKGLRHDHQTEEDGHGQDLLRIGRQPGVPAGATGSGYRVR
jgi:acetolactate synthase-1/3 small subunit